MRFSGTPYGLVPSHGHNAAVSVECSPLLSGSDRSGIDSGTDKANWANSQAAVIDTNAYVQLCHRSLIMQ